MESKQSAWNKNKERDAQLIIEQKKEELVKLLRWILKHYYTSQDIEGFFCWENPIGEQFDSIDLVNHYLKENQ